MDLEQCPWRSSRWSPRRKTLELLADYIVSQPEKPQSILEIGGGISTWYLSQLGFKDYVMVETYEPAMEPVKQHLPQVLTLTKWTDIPVKQYQYLFIDSHVGGEEEINGCRRDAPLRYIMENGLYTKDSILIAHDYNKIKQFRGDTKSRNGKRWMWWNNIVDEFGWKLDHEVMNRRCFGVYKLTK